MAEEKTKKHTNFYESVKEARMRISGTVVLYDNIPHYVLCVDDHNPDGIFRVYMEPLSDNMEIRGMEPPPYQYPPEGQSVGQAMDAWLKTHPKSKVIRKMMNSPSFNRFRPYPLGMINYGTDVIFLERQPTRKTEQGLLSSMVVETWLTGPNAGLTKRQMSVPMLSDEMRECIMGNYPSFGECLLNMRDDSIANQGAAFHRDFAIVRGPVDTLMLVYKEEKVGMLINNDATVLRLGKKYGHLREIVQGLGIFHTIN